MTTPLKIIVYWVNYVGELEECSTAEVALVGRESVKDKSWPYDDVAGTHAHSGGQYVQSGGTPPAAGAYLLVVRDSEAATVVQELTLSEGKDGFVRAAAGWNKPGSHNAAATVSIVNVGEAKKEADADKPQHSVIIVTLHTPVHFVAIASNASDASMMVFARGRRDKLFEDAKLNPGSHVYLISAKSNTTTVQVKSQSKRVDSWLTLAEFGSELGGDKVGILDFYHRLNELGKADPYSVVEAAYFGHGWHAGPVVRNTGDSIASLIERSPDDFDGRPKDWHPDGVIAKKFDKMGDAIAVDGRYFMAGCSHMSNVVHECKEANDQATSGTTRDTFYKVKVKGGWLHTTLDYSKLNIGQFLHSTSYGRYDIQGSASALVSYNGLATQTLGAEVWGPTPGSEANYGKVAGASKQHSTMKVVNKPFFKEGKLAGGIENGHVRKYYEREFGDDAVFDELGYCNYKRLMEASLPELGWSTLRHLVLDEWELGQILRLPSGLMVCSNNYKKIGKVQFPVPFEDDDGKGHMYEIRGVIPNHLQERNYPMSRLQRMLVVETSKDSVTGLFVTEDGLTKLYAKEKTSAKLEPANIKLKVPDVELDSDPYWGIKEPLNFTELDPGVVEKVDPKWYW